MIDSEDIITAANKAYEERFGNLDEVMVPEAMGDLEIFVAMLTDAVRTGQKITPEQLEAKFGPICWGL